MNLWWSVWMPFARRRLSSVELAEAWAWDGGGGGAWFRCDWACCCDCCCCIIPATACAYCIILNAWPILEWWTGMDGISMADTAAACALAAADCDCNTVARWAEAAAAEELEELLVFEALCCCCICFTYKINEWINKWIDMQLTTLFTRTEELKRTYLMHRGVRVHGTPPVVQVGTGASWWDDSRPRRRDNTRRLMK